MIGVDDGAGVVFVAFAGVAVFALLSGFDVGSVFVGVAAGLGQFAGRICVSPCAGCAHCALLASLFGLVEVLGFSVAGELVAVFCAKLAIDDSEKAAAAIPASNIERFTNLLPSNLRNKTRETSFGAA